MRNLFLLGLILALAISCKKKEETTPPDDPGVTFNYFPMKTGNYWVYRHYDIDTLGHVTEIPLTDSVVITGDSMINGKRYFVFEGTNFPYNHNWGIVDMLRDSGDYVVSANGIIRFSQKNFTDILASKTEIISGDTLYTLNYRMEKTDSTVTVPAGVFGALNYRGTVKTWMKLPGIQNPRYLNTYYADNAGCILQTYFFLNNPNFSEKRLVRYRAVAE
ncbi:MAG: hypothetical protein NTW16_16095 [Bacteroidetes bacterium]|nr:hypothetical protein [Bacteroidota bacterium]